MITKEFQVEINAPAEKVWFALWDNFHYCDWTSVFCEGSYAVTDWQQGSKYHFLSPNGEGMFGVISECVPNEKMYFTHQGILKDYEEQPFIEGVSTWHEAKENYLLSHTNGITKLTVYMDMEEKYVEFFSDVFPRALQRLKQNAENFRITVEATIDASIQEVWEKWGEPKHIVNWNYASEDWHSPRAENDLRTGGNFNVRMEAKDGSVGFDFCGNYTNVIPQSLIEYSLGEDRNVKVEFFEKENKTVVRESFIVEEINSLELQRNGWQAILNNFKNYTESQTEPQKA